MKILSLILLALSAQTAVGQSKNFTNRVKKNLTENNLRIQRVQTTFKPDTIVVFNRSGVSPTPDIRLIYQYDAQQRPTRITVEGQDTGFWAAMKRLDLQYNAAGLITRSEVSELDNGTLTLATRRERSYNAQGRVQLNKLTDFTSGSGANISGDSLVYNGLGVNPASIDAYFYDSNTNIWTQAVRFRNFLFNSTNQVTQASFATRVGVSFVDVLRAQNLDWKAGYPGLEVALLGDDLAPMIPDDFRWEPNILNWSGPTNILVQENDFPNWKNVSRLTQTLNGTQLATVTEDEWNDTIPTPAWESFKRTQFSFANNQITELTTQYFSNNSFVNDNKENVILGGPQGLTTRYETFTWMNNNWNADNLNTFTYSLDNMARLRYMAKTLSVFGTQQLADSLVFQYRTSTSTNEVSSMDAQIFPNPTNQGYAQVSFEQPFTGTILLRDISGKVLQQQQANGETRISLSVDGLTKGLYFVQWTDTLDRLKTGKLIIQ